mmetsp:Transcript_26272/g.56333  ORF Transcript_26272/g.56333 Transcript_26272/m.56333 type:complete len:268 (-) Transcript_26272:288-1091(-)
MRRECCGRFGNTKTKPKQTLFRSVLSLLFVRELSNVKCTWRCCNSMVYPRATHTLFLFCWCCGGRLRNHPRLDADGVYPGPVPEEKSLEFSHGGTASDSSSRIVVATIDFVVVVQKNREEPPDVGSGLRHGPIVGGFRSYRLFFGAGGFNAAIVALDQSLHLADRESIGGRVQVYHQVGKATAVAAFRLPFRSIRHDPSKWHDFAAIQWQNRNGVPVEGRGGWRTRRRERQQPLFLFLQDGTSDFHRPDAFYFFVDRCSATTAAATR